MDDQNKERTLSEASKKALIAFCEQYQDVDFEYVARRFGCSIQEAKKVYLASLF